MGWQKVFSPGEVTPHRSPKPSSPGYSDSTDFLTSAGWEWILARCSRRIFATWEISPRQLADRLAGGGRSCSCTANRGMSTPAPLQPTGLLFSATGFPAPPPLRRVGTERPWPPGLKFKLLVKKSWKRERKHPFRHPIILSCLLNAGSAEMRENNIPFNAPCPTLCQFTFVCVSMTHLQAGHAPVAQIGTEHSVSSLYRATVEFYIDSFKWHNNRRPYIPSVFLCTPEMETRSKSGAVRRGLSGEVWGGDGTNIFFIQLLAEPGLHNLEQRRQKNVTHSPVVYKSNSITRIACRFLLFA